jgi:hypothetical protein
MDMQAKETTREGYFLYIELIAAMQHISEREAQARVSEADFLTRLHDLHARHMSGEFTASKLADLLGVPALNLYDLLETMELPVRYY